jgi:hypothetical protein
VFRAYSEAAARHLHNHTRGTGAESGAKRQSNEAFSTAQADLDTFSIGGHAQDGSQAVVHKKSKFDGLVNFVQNSADWQQNEFQLGEQCCAFFVGKIEQDFVAKLMSIDALDGGLGDGFLGVRR